MTITGTVKAVTGDAPSPAWGVEPAVGAGLPRPCCLYLSCPGRSRPDLTDKDSFSPAGLSASLAAARPSVTPRRNPVSRLRTSAAERLGGRRRVASPERSPGPGSRSAAASEARPPSGIRRPAIRPSAPHASLGRPARTIAPRPSQRCGPNRGPGERRSTSSTRPPRRSAACALPPGSRPPARLRRCHRDPPPAGRAPLGLQRESEWRWPDPALRRPIGGPLPVRADMSQRGCE